MASTNLSTFLQEIADAIRTVTGKTEVINAQNFASEINNFFSADTLQSFYTGSSAPSNDFGNDGDLFFVL